ncbi:MAG: capsule assembly Wzi family protein [bacterium]
MKLSTLTCRKYLLVLVSIVSAASVAVGGDVLYPINRTVFGLDYDRLYRDAVLSGDIRQWPTTGPLLASRFVVGNGMTPFSPATSLFDTVTAGDLRLLWHLQETARARRQESVLDLSLVTAGLRYDASPSVAAQALFSLDREKAIDPNYSGKKWRGMAGSMETAGIYYTTGGLQASLGRQRIFWGPRPVNLILSATAEPLDLIRFDYRCGRLQFHFFMARLDHSRPDSVDYDRFPDYDFAHDNRYLVGHRIDIRLHSTFCLGLFETNVFGGIGRSPELYYLNPLQFFHSAQLNQDMNDNTFLGCDAVWLPMPGLAMWGQWLIDDFQIDRHAQSDQEPDEIGLLFGTELLGRQKTLRPDVQLEYVRITNRTYNQLHARNRYLHQNQLLGHPLGPDSDSLSLRLRWWPAVDQLLTLEAAYTRHGHGNQDQSWTEPWMEIDGNYSESFPTGPVETGWHLGLTYSGYVPITDYTRRHLFASVAAGAARRKVHDVINTGSKDAWMDLSLAWIGGFDIGTDD